MRSAELTVRNPSGLHARPAALFVEEAGRHRSRVTVENIDRPGTRADARSLLSVLTLGVSSGHRIRLTVDGEDENEALAALSSLVESGLGEGTS